MLLAQPVAGMSAAVGEVDAVVAVEIVVGDETTIQDLEYDILMVAALAEPKDRVFTNIWNMLMKILL